MGGHARDEGFHLKTRSVMKQLLEDVKWKVLSDKRKKRPLFKIRVNVFVEFVYRNVPDKFNVTFK
jgi:hypothetical protein